MNPVPATPLGKIRLAVVVGGQAKFELVVDEVQEEVLHVVCLGRSGGIAEAGRQVYLRTCGVQPQDLLAKLAGWLEEVALTPQLMPRKRLNGS